MKKRGSRPSIILIAGRVTHETLEYVQAQLFEAEDLNNPVVVRICSPGGDATVGLAIYDLLRAYPFRVETEAWGECASIAALILQAGTRRRASPNARLMVHNGSMTPDGVLGAAEFLRYGTELNRLNDAYNKIIAARALLPAVKVAAWSKRETWFTADQAQRLGLVDSIIGA